MAVGWKNMEEKTFGKEVGIAITKCVALGQEIKYRVRLMK
jgi:hypothetical protein